jgi:hypothetical protein
MDYKLISEKIEEIISVCDRCTEIISDDECNKDNKLQWKVNDIMALLGEVAGEVSRSRVEKQKKDISNSIYTWGIEQI